MSSRLGCRNKRFFDSYPEFYRTSRTGPFPNRLNNRYSALIESNLAYIQEHTILDIASHDGRWSFAALKNGAKKVFGVEGRPHLVENAIKNMYRYGISGEKFLFTVGDIYDEITKIKPDIIDTIFCFGFFYHTMNHMQILKEMKRLNPKCVIFDTNIATTSDAPILELREEDSELDANSIRSAIDDNRKVLVGYPNMEALKLMLKHLGFETSNFYDWHSNVRDWQNLEDYRTNRRVSFLALNSQHRL
jgi:Methyltransferase domain